MFPTRYILLILLLVCPGIGAQAEPSHDEASADLKAVVKQQSRHYPSSKKPSKPLAVS
jgi:hypothetical protein